MVDFVELLMRVVVVVVVGGDIFDLGVLYSGRGGVVVLTAAVGMC